MAISAQAIIALVALLISVPPTAVILKRWYSRRRGTSSRVRPDGLWTPPTFTISSNISRPANVLSSPEENVILFSRQAQSRAEEAVLLQQFQQVISRGRVSLTLNLLLGP